MDKGMDKGRDPSSRDAPETDAPETDAPQAGEPQRWRDGARGETHGGAVQGIQEHDQEHDAPSSAQHGVARERHAPASAAIAPHLALLEDRLNAFRDQLLSHRNLEYMYAELQDAIADPGDALMILLYGATRVGKTTLLDRIVRDYETKRLLAQAAGTWNCGHIPILRLAIPATGERPVSFRDIYWRILHAAQEPLIGQKRAHEPAQAWKPGSRSASEADLRWAVESMVRHRRPAAILLDEAQHLAQRRSAAALEAQLDCLKSLADATGVVYVLAGSYELLDFRNNNAQLSARSRYLHFSRYRIDQASDAKEFRRIVRSFGARMPVEQPPDLERHWRLLYRFSGGIVGVVKTWLYQALKLALIQGATTLTAEHLQHSAYELSQVSTMIQQAVEGETDLAQAADVLEKIDKAVGFSSSLSTPAAPASSLSGPASVSDAPPPLAAGEQHPDRTRAAAPAATPAPASPETKKNGRKRVGQRKPGRDRVGLDPGDATGRRFRT